MSREEVQDWLRTMVPVLFLGVIFFIGQREALSLLGQKVDNLTGVMQESNRKMEIISEKVIANDKEVGLQNYVLKGLDKRVTSLEDKR